jgi:hypothetical protein
MIVQLTTRTKATIVNIQKLWRGALARTNHRIKLEELFLLGVYFQKMSADSVLIELSRGSLLQPPELRILNRVVA